MLFNILLNIIILSQINGSPISKDTTRYNKKLSENPKLYQGDILLPDSAKATGRGVLLRGDTVAWPEGIVPYEIIPGFGAAAQSFIINTMRKMERDIAINNVACIQFRPRISSDEYYISILNGLGCYSYVGRNADLKLNRTVSFEYPGCFYQGIIMHELLHTLGFFHEQSRPDRDDYVKIYYENIQENMESNFEKYDDTVVDTQGTPYDYGSVMHYESDAFSINNLPTIEPLQPNVTIGQRYNMSNIDILEVRLFYNCSSNGSTLPPITTTTTANLYVVNTTYSSSWTENSQTYSRYDGENGTYYYKAYELTVPLSGNYIIQSDSTIDTYGYLYDDNFYPSLTYFNLIISNDDDGGNRQFKFTVSLQSSRKYIIIVTTYNELITGNYTLIVSGLNTPNLIPIIVNSTMPITTTITTTTMIDQVISTLSSELTTNSPTFTREGRDGTYYYEATIISVSTDGLYTLKSISSVDTFGYLYFNDFDPSNTQDNLLLSNDDSGGNQQFSLQYELQTRYRYILITTTFSENVTTDFIIMASGPTRVSFSSMNNISTSTSTMPPIILSASKQSNNTIIYLLTYILFGYIFNRFIEI